MPQEKRENERVCSSSRKNRRFLTLEAGLDFIFSSSPGEKKGELEQLSTPRASEASFSPFLPTFPPSENGAPPRCWRPTAPPLDEDKGGSSS